MSNPVYGAKVPHRMIDAGAPVVIVALTAAGAATTDITDSIFCSPEITDISYKMTGKTSKRAGISGTVAHRDTTEEGCNVTFTFTATGTTKAIALLGTYAFRVGAPVKVSGAPVVKAPGHEDLTSNWFSNILNSGTLGTDPTFFVESHDVKQSTTGDTTGTITLQRDHGMTAVAATTA